jgi:hypothetical protein
VATFAIVLFGLLAIAGRPLTRANGT